MFRTRKFNTCPPSPKEFTVPVSQDFMTDDGTRCSHIVQVPASSIAQQLPNISDYKLSALLRSGVPLDVVPSNILDAVPTEAQASAFLDSLSKSNSSNNE